MKTEIFERYMETGDITDEDWNFCKKIDWHPVDDLPISTELKKGIAKAKNENSKKIKSISEIFE